MNWLKKPSTTGGIVYLVVVGILVVGLVTAAAGAWRTGVTTAGLGFVLAFVMRSVLPDDRAGMLRVRRRLFDLILLATFATSMLVLAAIIPSAR